MKKAFKCVDGLDQHVAFGGSSQAALKTMVKHLKREYPQGFVWASVTVELEPNNDPADSYYCEAAVSPP